MADDLTTSPAAMDWEAAAATLCEAIKPHVERAFRRATDEAYAGLLDGVQGYLRDNSTFNLGALIDAAKRETREIRDQFTRVAEALGTHRSGWPCGPTPKKAADAAIARVERLKAAEQGVAAAERAALVAGLIERADWLQKEVRNGGDGSHLRPRETECRAIAAMIERGRFTATEPVQ